MKPFSCKKEPFSLKNLLQSNSKTLEQYLSKGGFEYMRYELFGKSPIGGVEFLGTYAHENLLLEALDQYQGMGYKAIKYCAVNYQRTKIVIWQSFLILLKQ